MKKSEWSDNELEDLLRQMPKLKDNRDPRDIYQSLSIKANNRKRPVWIIPSVASVAAVLLLFILAPNIWNSIFQDSSSNKESDIAIEDSSKTHEMTKMAPHNGESNMGITAADNNGITSLKVQSQETAIYEEDIVGQEVITYMIPDQNAQILVPVTVLVPKGTKTWIEQFQAQSEKLTEVQWGLSDFYPLNANLKMIDEETLNVDVPDGHLYGMGSANETSFITILKETFMVDRNIKKITLSTNGKSGISFGNYGDLTELNQPDVKKRSYYLFNPNNQNLPFLVPSIDQYNDIDSALRSMTIGNETYGLMPALPNNFTFDVDSSLNETLVLTFKDNTQLTEEPKNIYAIEAILLTAKDFGYKAVKFENAPITQIGRFNLQNEVKVPVAPNKVIL